MGVIQGISWGQSLSDVVLSLTDRYKVVGQRAQVEVEIYNDNSEDQPVRDYPEYTPIEWAGVGTEPTEGAVDGLDLGGKVALLNQAVGVFEKLQTQYVNADPNAFQANAVVGSLRAYGRDDFPKLPQATPENFHEIVRLLAQQVRALRVISWPSGFRVGGFDYNAYAYEYKSGDEVLINSSNPEAEEWETDKIGIWNPEDVSEWDYYFYVQTSLALPIAIDGSYGKNGDGWRSQSLQIWGPYSKEAVVKSMATGSSNVPGQIDGAVQVLRSSLWNRFSMVECSPEYDPAQGGYVVVGSSGSGNIPLMSHVPRLILQGGGWVPITDSVSVTKRYFEKGYSPVAEGGMSCKAAWLLPLNDPNHSDAILDSYERNWKVGCCYYSVFVPSFSRGVDAENLVEKIASSAGIAASHVSDGQLLMHPRSGCIFGIELGPGLKGSGSALLGVSCFDYSEYGFWQLGNHQWGYSFSYWPFFNIGPALRFDSVYQLRLLGSAADYHVVYDTNRSAWAQKLPFLGWPVVDGRDTSTLYLQWDQPRLKQIVGRDLVADIQYSDSHYGYTVNVYRRSEGGNQTLTPGQPISTAGLTLIRTWSAGHPNIGTEAHPTAPDHLVITGLAGETYDLQAGQTTPTSENVNWWWEDQGSFSWTLKLSQGGGEKFKKIIETGNHHSAQHEYQDGQWISSLASNSLDPFTGKFLADWQLTTAGKTITGTAALGNTDDPVSRYGQLPTSVSIDYDGIQPNASYTWDANGLLASVEAGDWSMTGSVSGGAYERAWKFGGSAYAKDWTEFLDGGNRVRSYSAPDGSASGKTGSSVAWSEVEYGNAGSGLPGLPRLVKNSDGTGATFDWAVAGDGGYTLTLESGLLSGNSVSRGTKQVREVNSHGFPISEKSFVMNGGTLQTAGTDYSNFTSWGAPRKATDYTSGLNSTWGFDANLLQLSNHSSYLGLSSTLSQYDALGRAGSVSSNGLTANTTFTGSGFSTNVGGAITGSFSEDRDAFGRLNFSNSTWNGVVDNLAVNHGNGGAADLSRTHSLFGTHESGFRADGTLNSASGPTLAFGGLNGSGLAIDGGLLKTTTALAGQGGAYRIDWTDAWGRSRLIQTPSTSGSGTDTTEFVHTPPSSSLKRVRINQPSGRRLIEESDPFNAAGAISRSGIDVNGDGSLGSGDRYLESITTASGGSLVTTLLLTEDNGLRQILRNEWNPGNGVTATSVNGGEETITRTPNYAQKKVVTSSSKGWSRTDTFNELGLTASSNLNGTGTPNATLTPTWRADGTLADVAFTLGGETHTATFKNNGTLATLTAPGRGNILGGHAIGGDTETLAVDGTTTARKLDGTQVSVSGNNVIGKTETLSTSGGGFQLTTHPATGADTAVAFNAAGAPTGKAYAAGAGESYAHFPGGLLKQVTLARGGTLEFGYSNDGAKDLVSATWPAVTSGAFACAPISQGYGYDAAGRINSVADASGSRSISYTNGGIAQSSWTGGALAGYRIVHGRDGQGRDTGFTLYRGDTAIHSVEITPEAGGAPMSLTSGGVTATLTKDGVGRLTGLQRGTVGQSWGRGTGGRILSATSTVAGAPSFNYLGTAGNEATAFDSAGRRLKAATAGGEWSYTYGGGGQLISASHPSLGTFAYGFDGIGRRTDKGSANLTDPLNRTLGWTNSQAKTLKVSAKPGARLWVNGTEVSGFTGNYSYPIPSPGASGGWVPWQAKAVLPGQGDTGAWPDDEAEQKGTVWVPPANETFAYDAAGNRQSGTQWDYGWDAKNQLVRARTKDFQTAPQGYDLTFAYDAEGRRFQKNVVQYRAGAIVSQKTVTFVWDGWDLVYERHQLPSGLTTLERKYVRGPGLAGGAGGLYVIRETRGSVTTELLPLYDGTGHVTALADSTGTLQAAYAYGPFGEPLQATGERAQDNPWRYASQYRDEETGLYYFGRRYLDPVTGQWLSREPLGESESLNLYAYCGNDPVNKVDVLGLEKIDLNAPVEIIPVPGMIGKFQVWFSVIAGNQANEWERVGYFRGSALIGEATKARLETDFEFRRQQQILAMRSLVDKQLQADDQEILKLREDAATFLPGGHAAVAMSREEYGKAAGWIVGEGVVSVVGGELLGRGLSYAGKTGYLMASGSTLAESRLILGLSKELTTGSLTSGTLVAATPLYATAEGALVRTLGSLDSRGTAALSEYVFPSAANSGPLRVTQYFDPKKGAFPVDGRFALSSEATLGNRLIDGITGPTTWVAPHAAGEMSMFRRLMTGVSNRRNYVEFDALPGELANPSGLKSMFGRYQQVIPGQVDLTGRNAVFGTSGFNWLDAGVRYGVPAAGAAGGGYLLYNSNK